MKIFLATDHAGFELKEQVKKYLIKKGYEVEDCGAYTFDKNDDYPDFIAKAAERVSQDPHTAKGIVFGGSGQAEVMVANKFPHVRAALIYALCSPLGAKDATGATSSDPLEIVKLTREHNDSNMLSLGARFLTEEQTKQIVDTWLTTPFSQEARHQRRHDKIEQIEERV